MSKGSIIQLAKERKKHSREIRKLEQRIADWEDWFQQGHDNFMVVGDPYHIIFHNIECPNKSSEGEDCGECWLCETNRLTHNKYRSEKK